MKISGSGYYIYADQPDHVGRIWLDSEEYVYVVP